VDPIKTQQYSLFGKEKSQLLVKYKDERLISNLKDRTKNKLGLSKIETVSRFRTQKIELLDVGEDSDIWSIINELKKDSNIEYVQPNFRLSTYAVESESNIEWIIDETGIPLDKFDDLGNEIIVGTDIQIQKAWEWTKGSEEVIVGILDEGISISHKDLAGNVFINKREIPDNQIDDDGNGYIDDISGWDFINEDNNVEDLAFSIIAEIKEGNRNRREELPGILSRAVEGCLLWQKEELNMPYEVKTATERYREEMDTFSSFIEECCIVEEGRKVSNRSIRYAYETWCRENGDYPLGQKLFILREVLVK
jgi:hypothetical protein